MAHYEKQGGHVEYYTPKWVFDAMSVSFDLDVAHPDILTDVPCRNFYTGGSLEKEWYGFVWMNPPYGNEENKKLYIRKFINHGNGIALMPDRTSSSWWQLFAEKADLFGFTKDKIKFILPDGTIARSPGTGNTFFAMGVKGINALMTLQSKGIIDIYRKL